MIKNLFGILKKNENRKIIASYLVLTAVAISMLQLILFYSFFSFWGTFSVVMTYVATALIFLSVLMVITELSNKIKILWLCFFVVFAISFCISGYALEYVFNTIKVLGLLTVLPNIKMNKKIIYVIFFIYILYASLVALLADRDLYETNTIILNTNTSSFICLCAEIVLVALSLTLKKAGKMLCFIGALLFVVMQFTFSGRASLIGTVLIVLYIAFQKYFDKISQKTIKIIAICLCFGAIIFALAYLGLYKLLGDDVYFLGKDIFSGREAIWADAFNQVNAERGWFFGIGGRFRSTSVSTGNVGNLSLHNQMMAYYTLYGALPLIAFVLLFVNLTEKSSIRKSKFFTVFLFVIMIVSYFETLIFYTSTVQNVVLALILAYFFTQDKEEPKMEQTQEELNIEQTNLTEDKHEEQ